MTDSFNTWGIFYTHCAIWTLKSAINLDDCGSEKIFFLHIAADCGEDRKTFSDEAKFECICTEMLKLGQKCKFLSFNQFHVNCSKIIGFCNAMLSPPFLGQITSDFTHPHVRQSILFINAKGTKGKCFKDSNYAIFSESRGIKDFKYDSNNWSNKDGADPITMETTKAMRDPMDESNDDESNEDMPYDVVHRTIWSS